MVSTAGHDAKLVLTLFVVDVKFISIAYENKKAHDWWDSAKRDVTQPTATVV